MGIFGADSVGAAWTRWWVCVRVRVRACGHVLVRACVSECMCREVFHSGQSMGMLGPARRRFRWRCMYSPVGEVLWLCALARVGVRVYVCVCVCVRVRLCACGFECENACAMVFVHRIESISISYHDEEL